MGPEVVVSLQDVSRFGKLLVVLFVSAGGSLQIPATIAQEASGPSESNDRVVIRRPPASEDPWTTEAAQVIEGKLQSFDAQRLVIVPPGGQPQQFDSDWIESIELSWEQPAIVDALKLLDERRYQEALLALNGARENLAGWQNQLLVAKMVQTASAADNPRVAGNLFLALAASKPPAFMYGDMPMCWTACQPDALHAEKAKEWLEAESDIEKLLGASWMLFGPDSEKASRMLQQVKASSNPSVARLAVCQSWRLVPPPETMAKLPEWQEFRDQLMGPLQLGPTEFLADRLMRVGQTDLAIGQWMRIAANHDHRPDRVRSSLESVSATLSRLGNTEEAERLRIWIKTLDAS